MSKDNPIELIAAQLLPQFIPKDKTASSLNFRFTMVPQKTYEVFYTKQTFGKKEEWVFQKYEEIALEG